ncbi:MAG: nuclease [endosymbiont of Seepiophila jonesi]|uniref:Nuclease n=1 Tax=endosymbiont of Lamellibrachia luymesi TaxID=2200907 RepID=A0A370DWR0_9GAMM|nr:MAG: nuclease [endosymbiont of Lamellibrachia luymesi]RDH92234.1 MAG: nuclease [endosymbiont of Seepiophila jonesi]
MPIPKRPTIFQRLLFAVCLTSISPVNATLVINEVDYDQPGSNQAEFIELFNTGGTTLNLDDYTLQLINGTNSAPYRTYDLPTFTLDANAYFVLCGNAGNLLNCDWDVSPDSNLIQNGAPDAIALFLGNTLIDSLSYEGDISGYTEISGSNLLDPSNAAFLGLSRSPDGADTNNNDLDFDQACITPGMRNSTQASSCSAPVNPVALPEPSSWLIMMIGLVGMLLPKRFREKEM